MPREIILARSAGQCFGVKRAFNIAMEAAASEDPVVMLGDIVHNEHVVQRIDSAGVKVVEDLDGSGQQGALLVRAHGAAPEVYRKAEEAGLKLLDATCPLVHEIHQVAREMAAEGYRLIVIGDHGHDEVIGIAGQVEDAIILAGPEEVQERLPKRLRKVGVVVQSTQNMENVQRILAELVPRVRELRYVDTICGPTKTHQRDIRTLPSEVDVMVIVGSFTSANTCRLTEISLEKNPRSYQVEDASGLAGEWFVDSITIGVTAGASTPDWIIDEVMEALEKLPD
ncbi:4-hydroxy-3-methylbut-2-enyl diphosphate reductase [bacterium]|nr:4-hydroxy-3-methylbut-2-enyl diphosphate reductase [bacterium]